MEENSDIWNSWDQLGWIESSSSDRPVTVGKPGGPTALHPLCFRLCYSLTSYEILFESISKLGLLYVMGKKGKDYFPILLSVKRKQVSVSSSHIGRSQREDDS